MPPDPGFPNQWGLHNTGQNIGGVNGIPGADIDAVSAWDIEDGQTNEITVAVLDSGINFDHPDLESKIWMNPGEISGNGIDDDINGYVDDVNGYNFVGISQKVFYYLSGGMPVFMSSAFGDSATSRRVAQSINGSGCELTHAGILLDKVGDPAGDITVSVRDDLYGADISSYTVSPAELGSFMYVVYEPLSSPVPLGSGTTYYLVIETDNQDPANHYRLYENRGAENGDAYDEGQQYHWDGGTWNGSGQDDYYFKTNPNSNPRDDNGHGTFVSGIVGAESNDQGIAGVSPGARIMPLKVLDGSGVPSGVLATDEIIEAIYYATDNGARVISMSLGSPFESSAEQDAIDYAHGQGVVLVAAAGNDGDETTYYPAGCENVIGAGATNNLDEKASFSNHNASVDVTAPGWRIYTTTRSGGYGYGSGTSAATPMVAGVAALILSYDPSLSSSQVEQVIEDNALDLGDPGRDDYYGYGRIDAYSSLSDLSSAPVEPPGPTIISPTWFLSEGTTAWGFSCYMTIQNPNAENVTADITYMTGSGPVPGGTVDLPANSQTTLTNDHLRGILGEVDFSTKVECKQGKAISVDRTMIWTGEGTPSPDGHCSVGVTSPAKTWYLPEGSSAWGFECWLLIQNPNDVEATAEVTYMIEGADPVTVEKKIPANSRKTYSMVNDIGEADASIKVEADLPVIPERAMYRNNRREGHDSIGTTFPAEDYYLAEGTTDWGFTTYVLVQNPNPTDTDVTVTYMTSSGTVPQGSFTMPGNSRKTIRVNDVLPGTDFSTQVHGSQPIIAERAMYWDNGTGEASHDSIGLSAPHTTFYLPDGQSGGGHETYTLVMNPNEGDVTVEVTYLTPDGAGNPTFTETVPANSRKTYLMADAGIQGRAAILVTCKTAGRKIMVERAMYWNERGAGTDTIGGYGD